MFKKWLENDELRRRLNTQAEEIDYLIKVWLRWRKCQKNGSYFAGRNREQYLAAHDEAKKLCKVFWSYPKHLQDFVREWVRDKGL